MAIFTKDIRIDLLAISVALVVIVVTYFKWALTYWKRKGVEAPPAKIPFGNATNMFLRKSTLGSELKDVYDKFKAKGLKYCGFYFLAKPILLVFDLELVRLIMSKDFEHFTDHGQYLNEENDPLSGNLFTLKGRKWKTMRAKLTPTFTSAKIKMMFQTLINCTEELLVLMDETFKGREPVDIKDIVGRFTTDVIGSCAFGIECNSLKNPNSEFREYGKKVFEPSHLQALKIFISLCFPAILDFFKLSLVDKDITDFFMGVVSKTVSYREKNNISRKDFMHLLIQIKNNIKIRDDDENETLNVNDVPSQDTGKGLTLEELTAQVYLFFLAGFETSSTTLTFCFYELSVNPAVQDELRQEINDVLAKHSGEITYDSLMDMTYMDKCINETLRKYPPFPMISRGCTKTYKIPGSNVVVENGTLLFVPILGIQHDPQYYPDPERFDPERFSPENKAKRHACTWLPFGEGPRACIGIRFGLMEIKVALAILLKNYKFSLNSKTKIPLVMNPKNVVLSVNGGVWLNIQKISK